MKLALIEANDISKYYLTGAEKVSALKRTDFNIDKGDFIVINGPSGSGKTTLLNILSGIDEVSSGEILFGNKDLNKLSDRESTLLRREKIGLVFQSFELIPVLSAWENVEYPLLLNDITKDERKRRVDKILAQVGLEKLSDHLPSQLSGGQRQRVAVARALVSEPEIVLADEPTGNLDTETGKEIIELMIDLNEKKDVAFLIVTHDLFINEYAERLIKIRDGVLREVSSNVESCL